MHQIVHRAMTLLSSGSCIHAEVQPGWVALGFDHRKNHTTLAPDEGYPNYDALALNREYIFSIFNGYY